MTEEQLIAALRAKKIKTTKEGICPVCGVHFSTGKHFGRMTCNAADCRMRLRLCVSKATQLDAAERKACAKAKAVTWGLGALDPFLARYDVDFWVNADPVLGF